MYVFIIQDTNQVDDSEPVTDVVGPYPTPEAADEAAKEWFRKLIDVDDVDMVFSYEVKPIRTFETSIAAHTSFMRLWQRIYNRGLDIFSDRSPW